MRLGSLLIALVLASPGPASGLATSDPVAAPAPGHGTRATTSTPRSTTAPGPATTAASRPATSIDSGWTTERARDDHATGVERELRLRGGLGLCGLEVPVEEVRRAAVDVRARSSADTRERLAATLHEAAIASLAEWAWAGTAVPPDRIADPRTLSGEEARRLVAGILVVDPERLGPDTWIELAPRRSGRRLTFQVLATLARPAEHLESARLDLHGTFALAATPGSSYSVEAEGRLLELELEPRAREHGVEVLPHRLELSLRGPRADGPTAYAR